MDAAAQVWKQTQEINKKPLSLEAKKLLQEPWEGSLYLLQAAQEAQALLPGKKTELFRSLENLVEYELPALAPAKAYSLMTASAQPDYNEAEMLEQLPRQESREDKLLYLLDTIRVNLEENGFNLTPSQQTVRD